MVRNPPEDSLLAPEAVAADNLHFDRQKHPAWTHEFDLRPWSEKF